jgi:hexosaminidase
MRISVLLTAACAFVFQQARGAEMPGLMPLPAKVSPAEGALRIDQTFRISLAGYGEPRLRAYAERLVARLARQTGLPLPAWPEGEPAQATLAIRCERAGEPAPSLREDESYRLEVTPRQAILSAATPVGAMRGMETFLQLVAPERESFSAPAVLIDDRPRFPWRGLVIDVARHYIPVEVLERNIDAMAAAKYNVLHLHISDDQGFRIESKRFPKLHQMGSDGVFYTQDEIRRLAGYARERGIRVLPEFDMPGHTTSWFVGHPELASQPGPYRIERHWGKHFPTIDASREETYEFFEAFLAEMAALFPDEYFHIGGDEVNPKHWSENARIQAFIRERKLNDNQGLQAYFNRRLQAILRKHGKKMVGWDEILHPDLPKDIVVQSWRGQKSLAAAARQGYQGMLSYGYYLDLMQPASAHYRIDPMDKDAASLTPEERSRILGGEACMWTENVSAETLDARTWPRAAAIAERLWSPQDVTDVDSMYRRLARISRHLDWLGLTHNSSYRIMLQRLAGDAPVESLQILADVLEPVKGYVRNRSNPTQQTPLNRLVDAARPESDTAREFAGRLERLVAGTASAGERREIREKLASWRDNHARLAPVLERSFLLQEAEPLSKDLAAVGAAGLEALDYLESGKHPPEPWAKERLVFLDQAKQQRAHLLLMVVAPVRQLVEAAAR